MEKIGSQLRPKKGALSESTNAMPTADDEFVFDSAKTKLPKRALKSSLLRPTLISEVAPEAILNSTPRKEDNNREWPPHENINGIEPITNSDDNEPRLNLNQEPSQPILKKQKAPAIPQQQQQQTTTTTTTTAPKKKTDELEMDKPESSPFSKPKYSWDVFRKVAREQMLDSDDTPQFATWIKVCRFIIYVFLFFIVLGSVVTSRLSFLTLAGSWKGIIQIENSIVNAFLETYEGHLAYQDYCHFLVMAAILAPTVAWLFVGIFRVAFSGSQPLPAFYTIVFLVGLECAHSFGVVLFVNRVIISGTNIWKLTSFAMAVSAVPSACGLVFVSGAYSCLMSQTTRQILSKVAYFTALFLAIAPFVIISVSTDWKEIYSWELPTSILLISFVWTLNLVFSEPLALGSFRNPNWPAVLGDFYRVKAKLTVISCGTRLVVTLLADSLLSGRSFWNLEMASPVHQFLQTNLTVDNSDYVPEIVNKTVVSSPKEFNMSAHIFANYSASDLDENGMLNISSMFVLHLTSTVIAFLASALACKLLMQQLAFALPLTLATPLTVAVMLMRCQPVDPDIPVIGGFLHFFSNILPHSDNNWYCLPKGEDDMLWVYPTVLILWYFGQNISTFHVWFSGCERLAEVEKLFVLPAFCSPFLEQWLLFNRRLNDNLLLSGNDQPNKKKKTDKDPPTIVPRVYACATMWHETREEMTELMKSVFRMDKDHAERKRVLETIHNSNDPETLGAANEILAQVNYYEYETHIIFDDSMTITEIKDDKRGGSKRPKLGTVPNEFVRTMVDVLRDAGTAVYSRFFALPDPSRISTPYGGRLVWMLPGGTLLVVHMKDKNRMRHKKRWSQVMYMYYLLGYKLYCQDPAYRRYWQQGDQARAKSLGEDQKIKLQLDKLDYPEVFRHVSETTAQTAENTFLLTLDGDVDFRAPAVLLLLDLMKKSKKVGAACGRIHPIGSGPLVWYQKFEYAIAHWLQKAAEHVFGCVLCTPGCFSLFRGSALMDDNVMRAYATTSTEAAHYVQYDQGEDRWLCTLLLQQGYRAEYSAAADALTHCPENFNEFYQQRRRWGPSTLSNIVDLLSSWRQTVIMNDNFSLPYVAYQMMLLISTLLGPATIIMMIAGAYNAVFHVDLVQAYLLSLTPPGFYLAVCLTCKTDTQINVAAVLSAFYAIIMLVVVVGTIINGLSESITSPNVIFMFALFSIFMTSASCHPREFTDLTYGWLYVLCIPAGYLLLTIYSLANLNNVSWGTRETPAPQAGAAQPKAEPEPKNPKKKSILDKIGVNHVVDGMKGFVKSFGNRNLSGSFDNNIAEAADTMPLLRDIRDLLQAMVQKGNDGVSPKAPAGIGHDAPRVVRFADSDTTTAKEEEVKQQLDSVKVIPVPEPDEEEEDPNIYYDHWLEDETIVGRGPIREIEHEEVQFWNQLIRRYAYPLPEDKNKKKKIAAELKVLRNNVVFAVAMMNFLWIVITFQLQYHQDMLKYAIFVPIPRGDDNTRLEYFEPLGMVFLFFFALILLVQYLGMLAHRLDTFFHLVAAADIDFGLNFFRRRRENSPGILSTSGLTNASSIYQPKQHRSRAKPQQLHKPDISGPAPRRDMTGLSNRRNRVQGGRSNVSSGALQQANYI